MMYLRLCSSFFRLFLFFLAAPLSAQQLVKGTVYDAITHNPLAEVTVLLKGNMAGTTTNAKGNFTLKVTEKMPFTLLFSRIGYQTQEKIVTSTDTLVIELIEQAIMGQEVVVSASRVEQTILESPVTIEKIGLEQLKNLPSHDSYQSLGSLKGVDAVASSLGYTTINVRGFGTNGNQRFVQLVDGMDNNAPGLGFSAGNLIGISELDLESMELLQGTASALYGANAINGVLVMTSKNPFRYQGASTFGRIGVNNVASPASSTTAYLEGGFRYAKAFYKDKLAFKLTTYAMNGYDWAATDYRDRTSLGSLTVPQNPEHEGINVYGDESASSFFLPQVATTLFKEGKLTPQQYNLVKDNALNVARTGYKEQDLAAYKTRNVKVSSAIHYRINSKLEASFQANYGEGTTNYTGGNRFSFRDFSMLQTKAELKGTNFYVRMYQTSTNSGNTYDISTLGVLLNEVAMPTTTWATTYVSKYAQNLGNGQPDIDAHQAARLAADKTRILPNSDRFFAVKDSLTQLPQPMGAGFIDRTGLYQAEGMYNFSSLFKVVEVLAGFNYRLNQLDSKGTLFADKNGRTIEIQEYGSYLQVAKSLLNNKLKITSSIRYDKSQNFAGQFTPRIAFVVEPFTNHFVRLSYQTGFRIPTSQNQYIDLDVIRGRAIGGLPEFITTYNLIKNPIYTLQALRDSLLYNKPLQAHQFREFKPEKVQSIELGYRTLINNRISVDAYSYYNFYTDFIKSITLIQAKTGKFNDLLSGAIQGYLLPVNDNRLVESFGYGISVGAVIYKGYTVTSNVSSDKLLTKFDDNEMTEYNTPNFRLNIGVANRAVWKNIGFAISYRWQDSFRWESTFATGNVPAYGSLDAQLTVPLRTLGKIKIGGSNILNTYNLQAFGNPQVGGLYYMQILLEGLF